MQAEQSDNPQSKGGLARAEALTPVQRFEIARSAARARWDIDSRLPLATHSGTLKLADIPCYVLENGERILSTRGIMKSLRRTWRGRKHAGTELPVFLEANNLKPFISAELQTVLIPRIFRTDKGIKGEGYGAEILPAVCEVYLRARDEGRLTQSQVAVAKQCEILVRGLSRVGIIALVDEATGYQRDRAKDALACILEEFIAKELRPWVHTFPDEFYEHLFKLRGLSYPRDTVQRPRYFGHLTNDIIYRRLAPGVLEELKRVIPKTQAGRMKYHLHRRLTEDIGHPKLREHLASVITLMKISNSYDQFVSFLDRAHPRYGDTALLPFGESVPETGL